MTKFILIPAMIFLFAAQAQASLKEDVKEGGILYNKEKYSEAAKAYENALSKDAKNGIASFGLGAAQYKERAYLGAIEKFNTAIASGHPKLIQASDYNIGNVEYRIGNLKEGGSFDEAKERYETALKFYKRAMDLNPGDRDAKFNYEFVTKKLDELAKTYQFKKDQNQQQDQQKKDENNKNKEKQNTGGSQGGEGKDKGKEGEGQEGKGKGGEGQAGGGEQKEEPKNKPEENKSGQSGGAGENQKEEKPKPEEQVKRQGNQQQQQEEQEKSAEQEAGEDKGGEGEDKGGEGEKSGGLEAYQSPEEQEGREMSEQEAKMLLEGYKGEEATGRAVRMRKRVIDLPEPAKDW